MDHSGTTWAVGGINVPTEKVGVGDCVSSTPLASMRNLTGRGVGGKEEEKLGGSRAQRLPCGGLGIVSQTPGLVHV